MSAPRIAIAALFAAALPVHAADSNQTTLENKIAQCQGCHGIVDWKTAFPEVYRVPKLSGQSPQYIVLALKQYKSGDRGHPTMKAIAASLSDDDMANIAAYYSQEPLTTAAK